MKALFAAALLTAGTAAFAQQTVAPGNSAPERDSRGIVVVSDPATAPAGANQAPPPGSGPVVPNPNQAQAFATQPSTGEKPPCSRTVTDNCTQTYERGAGRPR
jgi:Flp pilus assembly protein TadG